MLHNKKFETLLCSRRDIAQISHGLFTRLQYQNTREDKKQKAYLKGKITKPLEFLLRAKSNGELWSENERLNNSCCYFFLSGFSFTTIRESQDCRGRGKAFL